MSVNNYSVEQRQIATQSRELFNGRSWDECLHSLGIIKQQLPNDARTQLNMLMVASISGARNIELYEHSLYGALVASCKLIDPDQPDIMQIPPAANAETENISLTWLVHVYNYSLIQFLHGRYARTRGIISRAILYVHAVPFSLAVKMGVLLIETYLKLAQPRRAADIISQMQAYVRLYEANNKNGDAASTSTVAKDEIDDRQQKQRANPQQQFDISVARARLDWLEARTYIMLRTLPKASRKLGNNEVAGASGLQLDRSQQQAGYRDGGGSGMMPSSKLLQYTLDNERKLTSAAVQFNGRFYYESIMQLKLMTPKLLSQSSGGVGLPSPTVPGGASASSSSSVVADLFSIHQSRCKLDESMTATLLNNLGCLYASVSANTTALLQLTTALEFNERYLKRFETLKSQTPFSMQQQQAAGGSVGSPPLRTPGTTSSTTATTTSATSGGMPPDNNPPLQIRSRDLRPRIMFNLAHVLLRTGQHKMAFERFRELVHYYPQNPYVWLGLADAIIALYNHTYLNSFERHKPCRHMVIERVGDGVHRKLVLSPSLTNNPKDWEQYFTPMARLSGSLADGGGSGGGGSSTQGANSSSLTSSSSSSSSMPSIPSCTKPDMSMEFGAICADNAKLCIRRLFGEPKPNKIVESDGMFVQLEKSGASAHLKNAFYPLYPASNVPVTLLIRLRYRAIMTASFFNLLVGDYRTVVVDMSNMLRQHDIPVATRMTCHTYLAYAYAWLNDFNSAFLHLNPHQMKSLVRDSISERVMTYMKRQNDDNIVWSVHSGDPRALSIVQTAAVTQHQQSHAVTDADNKENQNDAAASSPSATSPTTNLTTLTPSDFNIPTIGVGMLNDGIQMRPPARKLAPQPPVVRSQFEGALAGTDEQQRSKLLDDDKADASSKLLPDNNNTATDAEANDAAAATSATDVAQQNGASAAGPPNPSQSAFEERGFALPAQALIMKYNLSCLYALQKDYETADKLVFEVLDNLCRSACFNSYLYARSIQLRIYLYLVRDRRNEALQLIKRECPQYKDRSWEIFVEDEKNIRRVFECAKQEYKY